MEKICIIDNSTKNMYFLIGVSSISPSRTCEVTEYPTSEGTPISDNVYKTSDNLNMNLMVDGLNQSNKSYCLTPEGQRTTLNYETTKQLLKDWSENATLLNIQTRHEYFRNMVLVSLSWEESDRNWTIFKPQLGFKEIRIAQVQKVQMSALNVSVGADYSKEVSTGANNGNEASTSSSSAEKVGGILGDTAVGAGIGAAIGSVIPGVGTALGAVVGGAIGFFKGLFTR